MGFRLFGVEDRKYIRVFLLEIRYPRYEFWIYSYFIDMNLYLSSPVLDSADVMDRIRLVESCYLLHSPKTRFISRFVSNTSFASSFHAPPLRSFRLLKLKMSGWTSTPGTGRGKSLNAMFSCVGSLSRKMYHDIHVSTVSPRTSFDPRLAIVPYLFI